MLGSHTSAAKDGASAFFLSSEEQQVHPIGQSLVTKEPEQRNTLQYT